MKELAGTKTEQNLQTAFSGESEARNKYTYFASVAKKSGYEQMAAIFSETADQEKEHAEMWFKYLKGIGDVLQNLESAAAGEHYEWTEMYKTMAEEARQEGFDEIAHKFEMVAKVEQAHENRYNKLIKSYSTSTIFDAGTPIKWKCRNCGYIFEGAAVPDACPTCNHPRAFFERFCENY